MAQLESTAADAKLSTAERHVDTLGYVVQYHLIPADGAAKRSRCCCSLGGAGGNGLAGSRFIRLGPRPGRGVTGSRDRGGGIVASRVGSGPWYVRHGVPGAADARTARIRGWPLPLAGTRRFGRSEPPQTRTTKRRCQGDTPHSLPAARPCGEKNSSARSAIKCGSSS